MAVELVAGPVAWLLGREFLAYACEDADYFDALVKPLDEAVAPFLYTHL
jgi:hypothetical protein